MTKLGGGVTHNLTAGKFWAKKLTPKAWASSNLEIYWIHFLFNLVAKQSRTNGPQNCEIKIKLSKSIEKSAKSNCLDPASASCNLGSDLEIYCTFNLIFKALHFVKIIKTKGWSFGLILNL